MLRIKKWSIKEQVFNAKTTIKKYVLKKKNHLEVSHIVYKGSLKLY